MASVFLSYDRDDAESARLIALALEKAGHSVWWDRHIKGGAQYSKEIEEALKRADAVVVLWSERSVDSAWVRDEAAAGRDSGRLVPVRLDDTEPPLGFRQYQTIDLSSWSGRGKPPQLGTVLEAVESVGGKEPLVATAKSVRTSARADYDWARRWLNPWLIIGLLILLFGLLIARPWEGKASVPAVTVVASDPSAKSEAIARNLLVLLGSLQTANADALQLVEPQSGAEPDLTFKVGAADEAGDPRASLSLIDNRAEALLWSSEFTQPGGNVADLRQQLAYSAAQVLHCATEALSPQHRKIEQSALKLYLNGCADLSALDAQEPSTLVRTFRQVTEQAPGFVGGWAKLLIAETNAFQLADLKDAALRKEMNAHIAQARKVNPTMAEAYLAEGWLQSPRPIIGWLRFSDEAVAKNPNHAEALATRSLAMLHVGRLQEAVDNARRAVQLEPLSPSARLRLMHALMASGAIEAARNELRQAERLWPGATNLVGGRFTLEYRYGDPQEALRLLQSGRFGYAPSPEQLSFLEARQRPSTGTVAKAITDAEYQFRQDPKFLAAYVQTLAQFGRNEELIDTLLSADPQVTPGIVIVLFRPAFSDLHADRRFMQIARRLGLVDFWRGTGRWPDFCSRADLPYDCKAEAAKIA